MLHNARVLQKDWVPQDITYRNAEKNRLRDALQPVLHGGQVNDIVIDGPSGAGKTCLSRYTTARLREQALNVATAHIDCWSHSTNFRVLFDLVDEVGSTHNVHRNTAHDELLSRLESLDQPLVAILDEADQLADKTILRELWGIDDLTLILIANNERDIFDDLDDRLQSRFRGATRVQFDRYTNDELVAILRDRVKAGLRPGVISDANLELIADSAAGNARDAIGYLRQSAQEADWDNADTITEAHIQTAIPEVQSNLRQQSLDKLSEQQRLVYDVLLETGELPPKEIYAQYEARAENPVTARTVRKYLAKLDQYNLVESEGRGKQRRYWARGGNRR